MAMRKAMRTEEFEKFVASQQVAEEEDNWDKLRDEWLIDLNSLYERIIEYLDKFINEGSITYKFTDITLNEENIGEYTARSMEIHIGRQHIKLRPVGTLLIGCKGRVDVEGQGRATILLVNQKAESPADLVTIKVTAARGQTPAQVPAPQPEPSVTWTWKILTNEARRRFVDLNQDTFFRLVMEVANG